MSPPSVGFMVVERARRAERTAAAEAEAEAEAEARGGERLAVEAFEPELQPGAPP
jgi:hypothetical protein